MLTNSEAHRQGEAPIPWQGIQALARHWAGAGSLVEWASTRDWAISREWDADTVQARFAYALLLHLQDTVFRYLPAHAADWLDLLEQDIHVSSDWMDYPDAHTDWALTLSEYGTYPPPLYISRKHATTFDTPLTRSLKWLCRAVNRASDLVERHLRQRPLSERTVASLRTARELAAVSSAADTGELDVNDIAACRTRGGVWALVGRASQQLRALWGTDPREQMIALAPILPQYPEVLFELGCIGVAASVVRDAYRDAAWSTKTPLAAATGGTPCLVTRSEETTWSCYYQTVPTDARGTDRPYATLAKALGGGTLRPDIWAIVVGPTGIIELLVECKYSRNPGYILDGIPQLLAYHAEYPPQPDVRRVQLLVGPEGVVVQSRSWQAVLAVGSPKHLRELVSACLAGNVDDLLASWAG